MNNKEKIELEILEMLGKQNQFKLRFPGKKIVSIARYGIIFGSDAAPILALSKGKEILLAKNGNRIYVSIPPSTTRFKGYKVQQNNGSGSFCLSCGQYLKKNEVEFGYYEIVESPVFYRDIDWYPLIKIADAKAA